MFYNMHAGRPAGQCARGKPERERSGERRGDFYRQRPDDMLRSTTTTLRHYICTFVAAPRDPLKVNALASSTVRAVGISSRQPDNSISSQNFQAVGTITGRHALRKCVWWCAHTHSHTRPPAPFSITVKSFLVIIAFRERRSRAAALRAAAEEWRGVAASI